MRAQEFTEARRNPELNPKRSGREEAVEFLRSAMGRGGAWGVSFTQVNKLGINPATGFNSGAFNAGTPAGVYFYPASYFVRTVEAKESFPFADHANFIQVFSYNPKHLLNLKTATSYEEETVNKKLGESDYDDTGMGPGPNIMMSVASYVRNHPGATSETWELHRVFRRLGYDAILDLGTGYIQENEPYSGVILDTSIIGQVRTFNNIQPKQGVAESTTVERDGITLDYEFSPNQQKLKIVALSNGRQLGSAEFQNYGPAGRPEYKGDQVHVDERYRGQGIATVMYDLARELVGRIYPSPAQTRDGEAFWKGKPVWEQEQLTEFDPGEGGFGPFKVYVEDYFIGQFPTYEEAMGEVDFLRDADPKSATHHWRIVDGTGETVWEYDIGDDIDNYRSSQKFQRRP
jgi:GNAT superfamily N-acetyltransferase